MRCAPAADPSVGLAPARAQPAFINASRQSNGAGVARQRLAPCRASAGESIPPQKPIQPKLPPPQQQVVASYDEDLPSDAEVVPLRLPSRSSASSKFEGMKVAVAGASGGVGKAIVERLVLEGVPVRALVRDPYAAVKKLPGQDRGVELRRLDVTQYMGMPEALADQDALMIAAGTYSGSDSSHPVLSMRAIRDVLLIATGARPGLDPFGPFNVDYQGTVNLVTAAKAAGVKKIVLVTSVGTDEPFYPLNLLWGVLFWKKRAEEAVQRSGINYTIVRPGGLVDKATRQRQVGSIVLAGPNTFGLPPKAQPGSILRSQVADICVEAVVEDAANNRVFEAVTAQGAGSRPIRELFENVAFKV